jgi:cold shock protein
MRKTKTSNNTSTKGEIEMAEKGTIRWFNNKKGYGFIQKDTDGKDIFVHYSAIVMEGYKTLKTNDKVSFEIVQGEKGPQAANVSVTASAPETK